MSAPPANMSGKGLMFVNSRITSPLLDEATFLKWYDEDHIPEILATGGMPTAIRFIDEGARAQLKDHGNDSPSPAARPYLHVYPVQDVAFFRTSQFADIGVTSDLLPGSKLVYDLADFDVRFYNLVQVYDPTNKGPRHTRSMLYAHLALKEGYPEEDLERWYREEHLADLAKADGYLRTTRYRLIWGRNSETSRALKTGSEPAAQPATPARLPEWFALHEFETDKVDIAELERQMTDWTKKIFANCDEFVVDQMRLDKAVGKEGIFDGEVV